MQATLKGRVTDSSGAVVPNAKIAVTNTGTNVVVNTVTDSAGLYAVPFLNPGSYSVSAEASGFKKFVRQDLVLSVDRTLEVDMALEVGAVAEQLTITGESPLLETVKADRGTLVDQQSVQELPLNGRNPFMLAKIVAGVNFNGTVIYQRPFDNGAIAQWTINGGPYESNEFLLDGSPNNAEADTNNIAYVPPVDAVQEFKIQTNSYDAQYGHTSGGIVNVSLKSGTNTPHGTVYEYARRKAWDANSFQNNAVGAPKGEHYLDQYGGQLAGPVYVPKVYDGRNKTFFLFAYEKYRENTPRRGITLTKANHAFSWYNSFQATYEVRAKNGLTLVANWSMSKQVYQNGYNDIQQLVPERSIYRYDQPESVTATVVYQLPFGSGKHFFSSSGRLVSRLVGGWEANVLFGYHSGIPWSLPSSFIYVKEAKLPNINWNAPIVQVVQPCVAQWNTNGTITMQSFSTKAGCTSYNFLSEPLYAPAAEPSYSGQIRTMSVPNADASLNKATRITERTSVQFRAEVFNLTNTFNFYQQQPTSSLTSSSFGTVVPANVSSSNGNQPRYIQLSVKFNF